MGVPTYDIISMCLFPSRYKHTPGSISGQSPPPSSPLPHPVGNHYINKQLWTLITIIDVSVQWDVRLTICKLRLGGWVGGWGPRFFGFYHPSHNAGGDASGTIALWALKFLWWVTGSSSVRLECTVLDRLVGAPPKPFCCLGWGIVVVFEMVVWPVADIIPALLNNSVCYYKFFNNKSTLLLHKQNSNFAYLGNKKWFFLCFFVFCLLLFLFICLLLICLDDCFPS